MMLLCRVYRPRKRAFNFQNLGLSSDFPWLSVQRLLRFVCDNCLETFQRRYKDSDVAKEVHLCSHRCVHEHQRMLIAKRKKEEWEAAYAARNYSENHPH